jgi:hypothetical protein
VGRTLASVFGVVALAFAFVGATAAETTPQRVALSGKQITIDEKTGKYEMQGSLCTGAFAKAKGVVFMKDVPTKTGQIVTTYRGTLEYGAQAARSASQSRTLSSRGSQGGRGG